VAAQRRTLDHGETAVSDTVPAAPLRRGLTRVEETFANVVRSVAGRLGVVSRLRWLQPPVVTVELHAERRSPDPLDQLSRQFDEVCATAVDVHQIAAALEAGGLNDRIALEQYARPDVFSLAAELHHRVPMRTRGRNGTSATTEPGPSASALIMRGPIYLIPALFFIGAGDVVQGRGVQWIALTALPLAWVWNQGLSVFIHRLMGSRDIAGASRMARRSLVAGTTLVTLIAWPVAEVVFGNGWLCLLAGAQTAYLIASATLLTFSRDRLLVLVLAPGAIVALMSLLTGAIPEILYVVSAFATVGAVVAALTWITRGFADEPFPVPSAPEVKTAGVHALLGGVWAALIALAGYAMAADPAMLTLVSLAAAPMVLAMGVAEWQLVRLRSGARRLLAGTSRPAHFAERARRAFLNALRTYSASVLAIAGVLALANGSFGPIDGSQLLLSIAFVFLGCATFAGLLLVSMGRAVFAVVASGIAVVATTGLIAVARTWVVDPAVAYGLGCLVLFLALAVATLRTTTRAVVYR
jgi:hypothetical protein